MNTFLIALFLTGLQPAFALAQGGDQPIPEGIAIAAELGTSLNSNKAKVGDPVKLRAIEDCKDASGKTIVPKGARLSGLVTVAVARTGSQQESRLSFVVDRAEWKGHSLPLHAVVAGGVEVQAMTIGRGTTRHNTGLPPSLSQLPVGHPAANPIGTVGRPGSGASRSSTEVTGARWYPIEANGVCVRGGLLVSENDNIELPSLTRMILRQASEKPDAGSEETGPPPLPDNLPIEVQLTHDLFADDTKVGSPVHLLNTSDVTSDDGRMLIPFGARLLGRVSLATALSSDRKQSALAIVVDRAEWDCRSRPMRAFFSGKISVAMPGGHRAPLESFGATIQRAADPNIVSVLVSTAANVRLSNGSRFVIRQFAERPE